jgi:VIT1/CCC1 family predicted Fe2+/Mn2+ transporter
MESWRSKLGGALFMIVAVAVVARVVWGLLASLIAPVLVLLVLGWIVAFIIRGPRSGGIIHK